MARSVAGRRNDEELFIEAQGVIAAYRPLDPAGLRHNVSLVEDAIAAEMSRENFVIGHVVAMREKHSPDPAAVLELRKKPADPAGRVDEDISFRALDKVGP